MIIHHLKPGQTIKEFIGGLKEIKHQLKNVGVIVDDTQLMAKILACLPSNLQHFLTAWDSTSPDERTLSALASRLEKEELNGQKFETTNDTALAAGSQITTAPGTSQQTAVQVTQQPVLSADQQQVIPPGPQFAFSNVPHFAFPAGGYPGLRGGFQGRGSQRGRGRGFNQRGGFHPYVAGNRGGGQQQNAGQQQGNGGHTHTGLCYYCGEPGHIKRTCRQYKKDRDNQQNWDSSCGGHQFYSLKSTVCFIARRYVMFTLYAYLLLNISTLIVCRSYLLLNQIDGLVRRLWCVTTYDGPKELSYQFYSCDCWPVDRVRNWRDEPACDWPRRCGNHICCEWKPAPR